MYIDYYSLALNYNKTRRILMKTIPSTMRFQDSLFNRIHTFSEGYDIPIFDVFSFNGLNQIIGYAKYINPDKRFCIVANVNYIIVCVQVLIILLVRREPVIKQIVELTK